MRVESTGYPSGGYPSIGGNSLHTPEAVKSLAESAGRIIFGPSEVDAGWREDWDVLSWEPRSVPYDREHVKGAKDRLAEGNISSDDVVYWVDWHGYRPDVLQEHSTQLCSGYMRTFLDDFVQGHLTPDELYAHMEELTLQHLDSKSTPEDHAAAVKTVWKWASTMGLAAATKAMRKAGEEEAYGSFFYDTSFEEDLQGKLNDWALRQCDENGLDASFLVEKPIKRLQYTQSEVTVRSEVGDVPKDTAYRMHPDEETAAIRVDGEWLTVPCVFDPTNHTRSLSDIFSAYQGKISSSNPELWRYLCASTASMEGLARLNPAWAAAYNASNRAARAYDEMMGGFSVANYR